MKKFFIYACGIGLIIFGYFYCSPISVDVLESIVYQGINGLFFNYALYFCIRYLHKKNILEKIIVGTKGLFRYFPNFVTFMFCILTFIYVIILIITKDFRFVGVILPALFSIDATSRSNRILKEYKDI